MPFRIETTRVVGNNYIFQLVDNETDEVLEQPYPRKDVKYRVDEEGIYFIGKGRDEPLFTQPGSLAGAQRVNRMFLLSDLLNADGDSFSDIVNFRTYMNTNTGNFSTGGFPGGTVPAPDISYFTKVVVQSRDQLLQYATGLDPNMIIPPYVFTNFEFDPPGGVLELDGLFFGDPIGIQRTFVTFSSASPNSVTITNTPDNYGGFVQGPVQWQALNVILQLGGINSRFFDLQAVLPIDVINLWSTSFIGGDLPNRWDGFDRFVWQRGRIPFSGSSFQPLGAMGRGINIRDVEIENMSVPFIVANDFTFTARTLIVQQVDYTAAAAVPFIETTNANIIDDEGFRIENCFVDSDGVLGATLVNGITKSDTRSNWSINRYDLAENTIPGFYLRQQSSIAPSPGNDATYEPVVTDFELIGTADWWNVDLATGIVTYNGSTPLCFELGEKDSISGSSLDSYDVGFEIDPAGPDPAFVAGNSTMTTAIATGGGNDLAENQVTTYRHVFTQGTTVRKVQRKGNNGNADLTYLENSVFSAILSGRQ